jgi:hypothetical protein
MIALLAAVEASFTVHDFWRWVAQAGSGDSDGDGD